jgi:hypothetical protein
LIHFFNVFSIGYGVFGTEKVRISLKIGKLLCLTLDLYHVLLAYCHFLVYGQNIAFHAQYNMGQAFRLAEKVFTIKLIS